MEQIQHAKARTPEGRWLRGVHVRVRTGPQHGAAGYVVGYAGAQVVIERTATSPGSPLRDRLALPAETIAATGRPAGQPATWEPRGVAGPLGLFTDEELARHAGILAGRAPYGADLAVVRSELDRRFTVTGPVDGWVRAEDAVSVRRHGDNVQARDWNGNDVAGVFNFRRAEVTPPGGRAVAVRFILGSR